MKDPEVSIESGVESRDGVENVERGLESRCPQWVRMLGI